jgi:alpha-L-rhamnosidase
VLPSERFFNRSGRAVTRWAVSFFLAVPAAHEVPAERIVADGRRYFVDFGKAAFGTLEFDSDIPEGETAEVDIRFGEKCKGNRVESLPGGSIVYHSVRVDIPGGRQTVHVNLDRYNERRRAFFDPVENTIPFRYAEIIGLPVAPTNVKQIAYWVPFNEGDSSFISSNPTLNQLPAVPL